VLFRSRYIKEWNADNPERRQRANQSWRKRSGSRFKKYGITRDQYRALADSQHWRCAICTEPGDESTLLIDHDHGTGHIRGLLCSNCNTAIGKLRDSPDNALRAARYLKREVPAILRVAA